MSSQMTADISDQRGRKLFFAGTADRQDVSVYYGVIFLDAVNMGQVYQITVIAAGKIMI